MTDDGDVCGHPTADGSPCQHPASEGDSCWIDAHGGNKSAGGRPRELDDDKREAIYAAVGSGLKADHVAAAAGISTQSLRRWTCCIDNLREAAITADDPCEFCKGYASAHANGAREVLEETSPEFRASASFGYTKKERQELTGEDGDPITVNVTEDITKTWPDATEE